VPGRRSLHGPRFREDGGGRVTDDGTSSVGRRVGVAQVEEAALAVTLTFSRAN
jgi:hypothetical protein